MMPSWCSRSDSSTVSPNYSVARRNGASFIQIGVELSKKCALKDQKKSFAFYSTSYLWVQVHGVLVVDRACSHKHKKGLQRSRLLREHQLGIMFTPDFYLFTSDFDHRFTLHTPTFVLKSAVYTAKGVPTL
jgi:hypothetical protein